MTFQDTKKAARTKGAEEIKVNIGITCLGGTLPLPKGTRVEYVNRRGNVMVVAIATGKPPRMVR